MVDPIAADLVALLGATDEQTRSLVISGSHSSCQPRPWTPPLLIERQTPSASRSKR
ncbi:MAG TPA: hypothetical protein VHT30_09295 [Acidimicrobiales bacterium]|jgi:hypothetical protein|nr:hypothetical protein [Acidimicrobiales bacterium]